MDSLCLPPTNFSPSPIYRGTSSSPASLKLPLSLASSSPGQPSETLPPSGTPSTSSALMLRSGTSTPRNPPPTTNTMDRWDDSSLTSVGRCSTSYPTWDSAEFWQRFPTTSPSPLSRESYAPSLDPTLLSTLIAATPATFPLRLQLEIAQDLTLPMAMNLLRYQVTTPALLPLTSETPPSAAFLLLLPGSLEPLWRVDLPTFNDPPPPPLSQHQSLAPPIVIPVPDSYPVTPAAVVPTSNLTARNTSVPDVTLPPPDTTSRAAPPASTSPTRELLRTMALSDSVNHSYEEGNVTEFVPLHDIPYIFLSPDRLPYLSIDEFLTSPDRYLDLSAFTPDSSLS